MPAQPSPPRRSGWRSPAWEPLAGGLSQWDPSRLHNLAFLVQPLTLFPLCWYTGRRDYLPSDYSGSHLPISGSSAAGGSPNGLGAQ